jgi:putative hemolysin
MVSVVIQFVKHFCPENALECEGHCDRMFTVLNHCMDPSSTLQLLIVLVLLSGLFSSSETALTSLSHARVRMMVEKKKLFSKMIRDLKAYPDRLLIAILIGNNIVNIAASVMASKYAAQVYQSDSIAIVVGVMTFIILVFGEIVPKTIAQRFNVLVAQLIAPMIRLVYLVTFPVIIIFELFIQLIFLLTGEKHRKTITEDELKAMIEIGHEEGEFEGHESELLKSIFEFTDTTAEEIMTNRNELDVFNSDITLEKAITKINKFSHSRIPVYEKTIDNIIGYITIKDLLKHSRRRSNLRRKVGSLTLHQCLSFPLTKPISKMFKSFQAQRIHFAVILDEYGSTAGIATMEDVLEEIVGDIHDEHDEDTHSVLKISKSRYMIEGNATLEYIGEFHKIQTRVAEHKTIAYLILQKLKAFPREGEKVSVGDVDLVVKKMEGKAIQKVEMRMKKSSS